MKLYRFTALDTQRAMIKINEVLGADALIYSTRRIPCGVEMLAGHADDNREDDVASPVQLQAAESNRELIDKLNVQLQYMDESIQKLTSQIEVFREEANYSFYQKLMMKLKNLNRFKRSIKEGAYEKQSVH